MIFDFSSNSTGPDMQKFSVFELSWSMLAIHQKSSYSSQDWSGLHQDGEYYSGKIMDGFW